MNAAEQAINDIRSFLSPGRYFPYKGKQQLKRGKNARYALSNPVHDRTQVQIPCRIGHERPYGVRYVTQPYPHLHHTTNAIDGAHVFDDLTKAVQALDWLCTNGPSPWSLFCEPVNPTREQRKDYLFAKA